MLEFVKIYAKEIISVLVPFIAWFLNSHLQPRARLVQGVRYASTLRLDEPTLNEKGEIISPNKFVNFAEVSFVNTGKKPASNVQVTFNWRPQHFNISPPRHFKTEIAPAPDNMRFTILLGTLPPREIVAIDILSVNGELPMITSAQCDECAASIIPLAPQEVFPQWKRLLVAWLMAVGLGATAYWLIAIIQWLAARAG